jgi:hypothetical protein
MMHPHFDLLQAQTRRAFLRSTGRFSLGAIAAQALHPHGQEGVAAFLGKRKPNYG